MTVASWMVDDKEGLVFFVPDRNADFTVSVYFTRDANGFTATRVDLLYFSGLFAASGVRKP